MHLLDEVLQHLFGDVEVGDDTILHGTDCRNVAGSTPQHQLGRMANCGHRFGITAALLTDGNHRGLIQHNAFALDVNQRVGGTQIDRQIVGKQASELLEHGSGGSWNVGTG